MNAIVKSVFITSFALFLFSCNSKEGAPESDVSQSSTPTDSALKDLFADAFKIGTAMNEAMVDGRDSLSRNILMEHCNTVTAENVMKAALVNPEPGVFKWEPADAFVEFGLANKMFIIGHTLAWHNQTPDWFFFKEDKSPLPTEVVKERLREHVETVAGRYTGKVNAWDVVNEVIDNDGSYRPTKWVKGVGDGDEFVKIAFSSAQKAAPDAELYYNDFNAWRPTKRDGIMRMVRMLQSAGIRIDGVGIQGHWGLNYPKNEYIIAAIDSFASLGVKVMITELDVDVLPLTKEGQIIGQGMSDPQFQLEEFKEYFDPYQDGLPAEVDQALADRYKELFEIFYSKKDKIDRVTFWGIADDMSWKNGYPIPGRTNYPLVWDRARKPKKALEAIMSVAK